MRRVALLRCVAFVIMTCNRCAHFACAIDFFRKSLLFNDINFILLLRTIFERVLRSCALRVFASSFARCCNVSKIVRVRVCVRKFRNALNINDLQLFSCVASLCARRLHVLCINATTRTTRNVARRNDANMTNDNNNNANTTTNTTTNNTRSRNARAMNAQRFTLCDVAREHNVNEKIARRRMRNAIARNDERVALLHELRNTNDARVRYEFDERERDIVRSIIVRD